MNYRLNIKRRANSKILFLILLFFASIYSLHAQLNKHFDPETVVYRSHTGTVNDLAMHPSGASFVSCGSDRMIYYWNINNNMPVKSFKGHLGSVNAVCFLYNGKYLISGGDDKEIRIWDTDLETLVVRVAADNNAGAYLASITSLAVDRENRYLLSGHSDNTIRIWKISELFGNNDLKPKSINNHTWTITDLAFLPGSEMFISTSGNNEMKRWKVEGGIHRGDYSGHLGWINAIDCDNSGLIASAGSDKRIILRHTSSENIEKILYGDTIVNDVKISPAAGEYIASGYENGTIDIWVRSTGQRHTIQAHNGAPVKCLAFTPNGKYLLSGSVDNTIRRWRADDISARIYFEKQIKAKRDTGYVFRDIGEYETKSEFAERKKTWTREYEMIIANYRKAYAQMVAGNAFNLEAEANKTLHDVKLIIDSIGYYNPEPQDEYFEVRMNVVQTKANSKKNYQTIRGKLYIPKEEAKTFKPNDNYKKAIITAKSYKQRDSDEYVIQNIVINHPILKKKYLFGYTKKIEIKDNTQKNTQ